MSPALAEAMRAEAAALRARADAIEAQVAAAQATPPDRLLTLSDIRRLFPAGEGRAPIGRRAILSAARRGELRIGQGPRRRLVVAESELRRWLEARPLPAMKAPSRPAENDIDWSAAADRELAALRGGR